MVEQNKSFKEVLMIGEGAKKLVREDEVSYWERLGFVRADFGKVEKKKTKKKKGK